MNEVEKYGYETFETTDAAFKKIIL